MERREGRSVERVEEGGRLGDGELGRNNRTSTCSLLLLLGRAEPGRREGDMVKVDIEEFHHLQLLLSVDLLHTMTAKPDCQLYVL